MAHLFNPSLTSHDDCDYYYIGAIHATDDDAMSIYKTADDDAQRGVQDQLLLIPSDGPAAASRSFDEIQIKFMSE